LSPHNFVEFHGRLCRRDGRPASPGKYRLYFSLHRDDKAKTELWNEIVDEVQVAPGGFYHVLLGAVAPIEVQLFSKGALYVATRIVRGEDVAVEAIHRVPVLARDLRNAELLDELAARLGELEGRLFEIGVIDRLGKRRRRAEQGAFPQLGLAVIDLSQRMSRVEESGDRFEGSAEERLAELESRATLLDADADGRVPRLEDEVYDIVGVDGDIVDLNERMDRVERIAGLENFVASEPSGEGIGADLSASLEARIAALEASAGTSSKGAGGVRAEVSAESLRVVKRSGDVMTGGLTINRGGLEVKSGSITGRTGAFSSIEVEHAVRAERILVSGLELRGDLTVDRPQRVLQVRGIEGRKGSAREDGPLHLNARGGDAVVIGNSAIGAGLRVHGEVASDQIGAVGRGWAESFESKKPLLAGTVVCVTAAGGRQVEACRVARNPQVIGVVVDKAGVWAGGSTGKIATKVALFGTADCCVEADSAPIAVGDLLTTSNVTGHARRLDPSEVAPGSVLGKALKALKKGRGVIPVVVTVG
jgi:hypothetical protein